MRRRHHPLTLALPLLLFAATAAGCAGPDDEPAPAAAVHLEAHPDHDHQGIDHLPLGTREQARALFTEGTVVLEGSRPFEQVGFFLGAERFPTLHYRLRDARTGGWGPWGYVDIVWSESTLHVGRVLLTGGARADAIELGSNHQLDGGFIELFHEAQAQPDPIHRVEAPFEAVDDEEDQEARPPLLQPGPGDDHGTLVVRQALAPRSLVVPRAEWGAISPDKVCGSPHDPYRISIHHSASANTGADEKVRMRGFQSYHIKNRGWCDIGYHFVVGPSGTVYQGRSDERRTGAHVLNQNTGNVGVCLMGNFESDTLLEPQLDGVARIVNWLGTTYGVAFSRSSIKGHREWPGQSTACPGRDTLNKFDTILARAAGDTPAPPPTGDIELAVDWVEPPQDRHTQGESGGKPDAFEGDAIRAVVRVKNATSGPLRGVRLGYWFEAPHLRATSYSIQTDHPARDGKTWMTNDADAAPENPAKGQMGPHGELVMYAFGAGETKRVVVELEVGPPSIGRVHHPDVRFWARHIDDTYDQPAFGAEANPNTLGKKLEGYAQMDVLSRDHWMFDADDEADHEGWVPCHDGHHGAIKLNIDPEDVGLLTLQVTGRDSCLTSPPWTRIDADAHDQLVLRVRSHDGPHLMALYFQREGDMGFDEARSVRFEALGNGELQTLVLPMASHPDWRGAITRIRIDPLEGAAPQPEARGWYGIDAVLLQSSDDGSTNAPDTPYVEARPVTFTDADPTDPVDPNAPLDPPGPRAPVDDMLDGDDGQVRVETGSCATAGSRPAPTTGLGALVLALLGLAWRRRQCFEHDGARPIPPVFE